MPHAAVIPSFQTVPNEILVNILKLLDPVDLRSACLLSKGLNDVVSSVLYYKIIWKSTSSDNNGLALALRRRSWLRSSVRQLLINDLGWDYSQIERACKELTNFPLLTKIIWIRKSAVVSTSFQLYVDAISGINTLEELQFPSWPYKAAENMNLNGLSKLTNIRSLEFMAESDVNINSQWFKSAKLSLLSLSVMYHGTLSYLLGCRKLEKLNVRNIQSLTGLINYLADLDQVRELWVSFQQSVLISWGNTIPKPPGLHRLQSLRIQCDGMSLASSSLKRHLCELYECIASESRHLVDLKLGPTTYASSYFETKGDIFITSALRNHRASIRSFALPGFSLPVPTLTRLMCGCLQLEELGFQSFDLDFSIIGPILGNSQQLKVIRIAAPNVYNPEPLLKVIPRLLEQTLQNVCRLYIQTGTGSKSCYILWEARWVYDNDLQRTRRHIGHIRENEGDGRGKLKAVFEDKP